MINRIVLIGNGFDLAHGLKTSYKDFIEWYWNQIKQTFLNGLDKYSIGDDILFNIKSTNSNCFRYHLNDSRGASIETIKNLTGLQFYNNFEKLFPDIKLLPSKFLKRIMVSFETKKWVDIENEYYQILRGISVILLRL